ncbi:cupin domain-containing protein [Actinomadura gamaensis]|uniref:cupin domain-containing protein n=1 Tax=Actinomadura gamaensis TaxID=1763541 RepID=UPI00367308E8
MQKLQYSSAELTEEYGIRIGRWSQYAADRELPFDAMWCVIPPGGSSERDQHPEVELSVVASGHADYESPESGERTEAAQGAAVLLPSREPHVIHNRSDSEPLVLLSIYWMPEEEMAE